MDGPPSPLSAGSNNIFGDRLDIPGGPDDPDMKDEENELNPETSILLKDPQQQYLYAVETVRQLRARLIRRTNVIDEIRKFYLRDVVTLKHVLNEVLSGSEKEEVWREYESTIPSINLKQMLKLHAPTGGEFKISPCEKCGGQLEIVMKDTDEVEKLKKVLSESKDRENRWREKLANLDVQIEEATREKAEGAKGHMEEKRVLYAEMKKLRDAAEKYKSEATQYQQMHKKLKEEHENFKRKNADLIEATKRLEVAEQELSNVKSVIEEKEESIRTLKIMERNLSKDLELSRNEIQDLSTEKETLQIEVLNVKNEAKAIQTTLSTVTEQFNQNKIKLESKNKDNEELQTKYDELSNKLMDMRVEHIQQMEATARELDSLKFEIKELNLTYAETDNDLEHHKKELSEAITKIAELNEVKKHLEMELLDSADEIELFEEEIAAMQQFIREKISQKDSDDDSDGDGDDIMREFEEFREQFDAGNEEEEEEDSDDERVKTQDEGDALPEEGQLPSEIIKKSPKAKKKAPPAAQKPQDIETNPDEEPEVTNQATPTNYSNSRDRRQAMAVRRQSRRRLGGGGGDNAPSTAAALKRNLRMASEVNLNPPENTQENSPAQRAMSPLAKPASPTAGGAVGGGGGEGSSHARELLMQQRAEKKRKKNPPRKKSERPSVLSKQKSYESEVEEGGMMSPTGQIHPVLLDPSVLMELNHRENLFGIPDQKHELQKDESKKRRRSIPRSFIYYPLSIEPKDEAAALIPENNVPTEKPKKKVSTEAFARHTKEILQNTKGRIQDIKSMLQETPPPTARSETKSSKGNGRRKTKNGKKGKNKVETENEEENNEAAEEDGEGEEEGASSPSNKKKRNTAVKVNDSDAVDGAENTSSNENTTSSSAAAAPEKPPAGPNKAANSYATKKDKPSSGKEKDRKQTAKVVIPVVELMPPPDNATKFELAFRLALLTIMRNMKGMNENFTHTVFNGLHDFIHTFCSSLYELLQNMWKSLSNSKISLDFLEKLSIVFQGIMNLNLNPDANTSHLGELCATIVPLAGATLNASVTQQWQEKVLLHDEVLLGLLPTVVNYETGERKNRSLTEFLEDKIHIYPYDPKFQTQIAEKTYQQIKSFNPNMNEKGIDETIFQYFPKFQLMNESAMKFYDYINSLNIHLSASFIEILRDWSSAKTIYYELEKRLENEREKTKKPLENKIAAISKELTKITTLYEKNQDFTRNLELKLKEYEKYEVELKKCEIKLIDSQKEVESIAEQFSDLNIKHTSLTNEHQQMTEELSVAKEFIKELKKEITDLKGTIKGLERDIVALKTALAEMTDLKNQFENQANHLLDLEDRRLNRIISVSMQTEPEVAEIGLQTEFFMPPMDLKTVVVNKLSRSGLRKYPLVFSQSLEYLPDLKDHQPQPQNDGPQTNSHHFNSHGNGFNAFSQTAPAAPLMENHHPLILGRDPNVTNTNFLTSKLKTNESLANPPSKAGGGGSSKLLKQATMSHVDGGSSLNNSTDGKSGRYSYNRSDSTDSLQFNMDFRAHPPVIHYQYSQQGQQHGNPLLQPSITSFAQQQQLQGNALHPFQLEDDFSVASDFQHVTSSVAEEMLLRGGGGGGGGDSIASSAHSMPKLYKSNQPNNPMNQLHQSSQNTSSLQPSLMTISIQHKSHAPQPPQLYPGGSIGFEPSQVTEASTIVSPHHHRSPTNNSNNNPSQDIINGIVYNHRANNHYNNLIYKTHTNQPSNHASAIGANYDRYYQNMEENTSRTYPIDALSITSLSSPTKVLGGGPGGGGGAGGGGGGGGMSGKHGSSKHSKENPGGSKKLVFPEINPSGQGNTGEQKPILMNPSDTIRRLQKEFF